MGSSLDATASLADGTAGKEGSSDARTEGTVAVPTLQDIFQQHVEHAMKEPKSLVKGGSFLINTVSSEVRVISVNLPWMRMLLTAINVCNFIVECRRY